MEFLKSIYPSLSDRRSLPLYYTPACFALSILPFLVQNKRLVSTLTFPLLLYLCASWPCFTSGDPASEYYNNSHFIALPLWYLDFVFLTPQDGEGAPAFIGSEAMNGRRKDEKSVAGQRWQDMTTFSQRVKWSIRLMLPAQRGVGWNWQVKGVPSDPDAALSRWQYVSRKVWWALLYYVQSVVALGTLGFAVAMTAHPGPERAIAHAAVGWAGAVWVWCRLCCAYSVAAALGVGVGATGTWEWPPLMGRLEDAWSVRQMWSATYHQACRRLLSQPSIRITRFLGLPKGSTASSYSQLFLSFGISCLFHQAQMFNVTRKDMGELAFFMSQPLAIVAEDIVHWLWMQSSLSGKNERLEKIAGYIWTFAWFSFSLHFYVSGLVEAEVMKDWVFGYKPLNAGSDIGHELLSFSGLKLESQVLSKIYA